MQEGLNLQALLGQHKERHHATGLVQRINVYSFDNGYWDCYREDELLAA